MNEPITVPMDVYDSPTEMVVIMPLWWVDKQSVRVTLSGTTLTLHGTRVSPMLKDALMPLQEQCYRGDFVKEIAVPAHAATDRIHSELSPENILTIIIPKIVDPAEIIVEIT